MLDARTILVVDDSRVMRETLTTLLDLHERRILSAASCREALTALDATPEIELALCDVRLPDGDGFQILEYARARSAARPAVILMTATAVAGDDERALRAGAAGHLVKPIRMSQIARLWAAHGGGRALVKRAVRRPCSAKVWLLEEGARESLISWDLQNLSHTGAFVRTRGPLAIGARLELELALEDRTSRVAARVVRVQEPSWMYPGGAGVHFEAMDDESRAALDEFIDASGFEY